ncbi:MAG: hypothetical protein MJZ76_00925 [Bacteroidales bacterium]|nr:hypothetical protein [Bacteroidales bacterium]
MKKLILTPTKDTITICLPEDWVGRSISCILDCENENDIENKAAEPSATYSTKSSLEETWDSDLEDELWKNI